MKTEKVSWGGIIAGIIIGAILYFAFFLLVIPNWSIFP